MSISAPLFEKLAGLPAQGRDEPREAPLAVSRKMIGQSASETKAEPLLLRFLSHPLQHDPSRPPRTTFTKVDREPTDAW